MGYKRTVVIHPGKTLEEHIDFIGMPQKELADRTGLAVKTVNEIINGKNALTSETAIKLERVLDIPAHFWNNLQKNYLEAVAKQQAEERLQKEITLAKNFKD